MRGALGDRAPSKGRLDLPARGGWIISSMRPRAHTAREPDLGARLVSALRQALRERRLDVADLLLQAIEIHGADRTTEAGYLLVAKTIAEERRPAPRT